MNFPRKRFRKIYVEITNHCNLRCSFCSVSHRKHKHLSVEEFQTIVAQIAPHTNFVYLHVKGEPLLHPLLPAILDLCRQFGLLVVIVTNGTLLGSVESLLIAHPSIRQINISLHCYEELSGATLRQQYLNSVVHFTQRALQESNLTISLRLWNLSSGSTASAQTQTDEIVEAIHRHFPLPPNWKNELPKRNGLQLSDRLWLNSDYQFEWPSLTSTEIFHTGTCNGLRDQLAILSDGTVVPCCIDTEGIIALGNIFEQPLEHIVNSSRALSIIQAFRLEKRVEPLCRRCSFFPLKQKKQ